MPDQDDRQPDGAADAAMAAAGGSGSDDDAFDAPTFTTYPCNHAFVSSWLTPQLGNITGTILRLCAAGEGILYGGLAECALGHSQHSLGRPVHPSYLERRTKDADFRIKCMLSESPTLVAELAQHGWRKEGACFFVPILWRTGRAKLRVSRFRNAHFPRLYIEVCEDFCGSDPVPFSLDASANLRYLFGMLSTSDTSFSAVLSADAAGALAFFTLPLSPASVARGLLPALQTGRGTPTMLALLQHACQGGRREAVRFPGVAPVAQSLRAIVSLQRFLLQYGGRPGATGLRGSTLHVEVVERLQSARTAGLPVPTCAVCWGQGEGKGLLQQADGGGPFCHARCERTGATWRAPGDARKRARQREARELQALLERLLQLPAGAARGLARMHARFFSRLSNFQILDCETAFLEMPDQLDDAARDASPMRGFVAALHMTPGDCRELARALRCAPPGCPTAALLSMRASVRGGLALNAQAHCDPGSTEPLTVLLSQVLPTPRRHWDAVCLAAALALEGAGEGLTALTARHCGNLPHRAALAALVGLQPPAGGTISAARRRGLAALHAKVRCFLEGRLHAGVSKSYMQSLTGAHTVTQARDAVLQALDEGDDAAAGAHEARVVLAALAHGMPRRCSLDLEGAALQAVGNLFVSRAAARLARERSARRAASSSFGQHKGAADACAQTLYDEVAALERAVEVAVAEAAGAGLQEMLEEEEAEGGGGRGRAAPSDAPPAGRRLRKLFFFMGNYAEDLPSGRASTKFPARVLDRGVMRGLFEGFIVYEGYSSALCVVGPPWHSRIPVRMPQAGSAAPAAGDARGRLLWEASPQGRGRRPAADGWARWRGAQLLNVWEVAEGEGEEEGEGEGEGEGGNEGGGGEGHPAAAAPPATRKGPGGVLDVCGHPSHEGQGGTGYQARAHDPPATKNLSQITAAGPPDANTALPLHPRHPRFTLRSLRPIYLGTCTYYVVYGLGFMWQGGSGRE